MIVCLHVPCSLCFAKHLQALGLSLNIRRSFSEGRTSPEVVEPREVARSNNMSRGPKTMRVRLCLRKPNQYSTICRRPTPRFLPHGWKVGEDAQAGFCERAAQEPRGQSPLDVRQKATAQGQSAQTIARLKPCISYPGPIPQSRHIPFQPKLLRYRASLTCQSPTLQRFR